MPVAALFFSPSIDAIRRYSIDGPGLLTELDPISSRVASGPRRTIIHPSGKTLYTLHEIDNTLSVAKIDTDTPYGDVHVVQDGWVHVIATSTFRELRSV